MDLKYIHDEQRRQMEIYKWVQSERAQKDLGETCMYGWVEKHAKAFRKWAESIPEECTNCGECMSGATGLQCSHPFNENRLKLIDALWRE